MTAPRPILLFDVMDTLVREPFFTDVPAFFGMTLDELFEHKHPTSWVDFEHGRIDEERHFATFFRDGRPVDGDGLRAAIVDGYRWLDGMEALLAELRDAGYEIHALSNYPVWYRLLDDKLDLSRYLHWTFVSCRTGLRKPDPAAYLDAARHLDVEPGECLFVDDRRENIDAARGVGMPAILATDADAVRAELVERGVLAAG